MEIYVDELPKKCKDCPFSYVGYAYDFDEVRFCKLHKDHCMHWIALYNDKFNDCPLKLLTDRLAEERKKVIERIRDLAEIYTEPSAKGFDFDTYILTEENLNKILDKAERGSYE